MSRFRPALRMVLALSAPLLILLALVSLASRSGTQRLEAVPALVIGTGLLVSSGLRRAQRRRILLEALRLAAPPPASGSGDGQGSNVAG
ncbi:MULTISPECIES: DUF3188 domain-containing protein [unclassified Synechococcus]|uniref:DUF3188 domain-containing protein n=1 Tax=unclassified Synechococcus TaxID=2626047 RepID=UPI0020CC1BB1|nr:MULTISPECIES: DUF3188 domain-containing protein [unclassified Synechococcus]